MLHIKSSFLSLLLQKKIDNDDDGLLHLLFHYVPALGNLYHTIMYMLEMHFFTSFKIPKVTYPKKKIMGFEGLPKQPRLPPEILAFSSVFQVCFKCVGFFLSFYCIQVDTAYYLDTLS